MRLILKLLGACLFWCGVALAVVLVVLLPRETDSYRTGPMDNMHYNFTWESYKNNIVNYYENVKENKTLGITVYEIPVEEELAHYGKRTVKILIPAIFLSVILGIWKGVYDYTRTGKAGRLFGKYTTWLGQSLPDFFLIFLIQTFLFFLMHNTFIKVDMYGDEHWFNLIMPTLFLAMYPVSLIAKYTAEALQEEEGQDYVRTAMSKGAKRKTVVHRHMLPNCYPKLVQHFMPIVVLMLSSMFVIEFLTMYRGIGTRLVYALSVPEILIPGAPIQMDTGAIIGFSLAILAVLFAVQVIDSILKHFVNKRQKEVVS